MYPVRMLSFWYFELLVNYVLLRYDYEKEKLSMSYGTIKNESAVKCHSSESLR